MEKVDCCELAAENGWGWEETKELGGTRGNLSDLAAGLSTFSFRCIISPFGAGDADSTSKGRWTT